VFCVVDADGAPGLTARATAVSSAPATITTTTAPCDLTKRTNGTTSVFILRRCATPHKDPSAVRDVGPTPFVRDPIILQAHHGRVRAAVMTPGILGYAAPSPVPSEPHRGSPRLTA
jgi:hypothetical protein